MSSKPRAKLREALHDNSLEGEDLLLDAMFGGAPTPGGAVAARVAAKEAAPKPDHYKVVSISLYIEDIARLESYVLELKKRGHYKANKSQIIRQALAQLDLDRVPKRD